MLKKQSIVATVYSTVTLLAFAAAIAVLLTYTPTEATMGPVQKIFYLHLPVAINTFVSCVIVFIASIGYLCTQKTLWDDLAAAAAKTAVQLCAIVLLTGMIWGRGAWGQWWTWSPRLTFSLALFLLYVVYLVVRSSIESRRQRAVIAAVYAIIAFLDVPLVWLSARMMPDIHPGSIQLAPAMKLTLGVWFVPVTMLALGLTAGRFVLLRRATALETNKFSAATAAVAAPARSAARRFQLAGGVL
jgi:heme exporter protein C